MVKETKVYDGVKEVTVFLCEICGNVKKGRYFSEREKAITCEKRHIAKIEESHLNSGEKKEGESMTREQKVKRKRIGKLEYVFEDGKWVHHSALLKRWKEEHGMEKHLSTLIDDTKAKE